jgi:hypothetical protein
MVGILGGPRRRWEDNIKMDQKRISWEGVDWIYTYYDKER